MLRFNRQPCWGARASQMFLCISHQIIIKIKTTENNRQFRQIASEKVSRKEREECWLTIDSKSSRATPDPAPSKLSAEIRLIDRLTGVTPVSVGGSVSDGQEGVGQGRGTGGYRVARIWGRVNFFIVLIPGWSTCLGGRLEAFHVDFLCL